ncbi:conserved hypothetical protein [Shewanella sediminis HAW-EB3]|uniref:Macro domain-containing protein n=1 Tax=Shewanella sediminis (strain HAW-EB3) TaxID=425104 RepID=A8FSV2_SHESH|nr:macro domain-containing protein [Shewanella sediminis]ABV35925.1 conserved hypothetical protein [Shewanella sediminis HAW-EB3]
MIPYLPINKYRQAIKLDQATNIKPTAFLHPAIISVLEQLNVSFSPSISQQKALEKLHGALALVEPYRLPTDLMNEIDSIAACVNAQQPLTDTASLPSIDSTYTTSYPAAGNTSIWVGDITQLKVDAIINAANVYLLGCRQPNHRCIDNVIHSAAGSRLRDDCATIIEQQGGLEPTGSAKITRGYALPAKYVIHTVGPCLHSGYLPDEEDEKQLKSAYQSCLTLASEINDLKTLAFCAISTGVFSYPKIDAASVALETVSDWLSEHPQHFEKVVFNLYTQADAAIYERLIYEWT